MVNQAQPAYLVAMLDPSDIETFMQDYGQPVFPTIIEAGGEVLVATPTVTVLEGSYSSTWTVIIRFPSIDMVKTWYQSDRYQPFIPIRQSLSHPDNTILIAALGFGGLPE